MCVCVVKIFTKKDLPKGGYPEENKTASIWRLSKLPWPPPFVSLDTYNALCQKSPFNFFKVPSKILSWARPPPPPFGQRPNQSRFFP